MIPHTHLLDTDHVAMMDRGGQEGRVIRARIAAFSREEVVASIISYEEQMRGWLAFINTLHTPSAQIDGYLRLESLLEFYCETPLLSFDAKAVAEFERLKQAKIRIGTMDLKIAAIPLASNAVVLTRNLSDFGKVPGLRVEDWSV